MKLTGYIIVQKELSIGLKLLFRDSGGHCSFEGLETLIQPNGRTLVTFGSLTEAVKFIITAGFTETAEVRICEEARDKDGLPNGICFAPVFFGRQ